ncbi:MAG TPA: hypothetical protein VJ885_14145 [Thermoanaerobaculia bacterium]|nr:hypothetical protein [Thermoanaerobaculia bacterium]
MLRPDCQRFREGFTPGTDPITAQVQSQDQHRRSCPACAAFADAMERAASAPKLELPSSLRGQLRGLPSFVRHDAPRLPVPQAPLPPGLRDNLQGIARRVRRQPPFWVRNSRYAVAASYFLAVVMTYALGDPAALSIRATDTLTRTVGRTWSAVRDQRLPEAGSALSERLSEGYGAAVDTLESSLESSLDGLRSEVREITRTLSPEESNDKEKP